MKFLAYLRLANAWTKQNGEVDFRGLAVVYKVGNTRSTMIIKIKACPHLPSLSLYHKRKELFYEKSTGIIFDSRKPCDDGLR